MTATMNGHAELFTIADRMLGLFRGRADRVAVPNGADFKPEVLGAPLTAERLVKDHLLKRACLGFYLMTVDNKVWCSCADLDNKPDKPDPDWREKATKAANYLNGAGLSPLVEISQSGNAAHVWVFFSEPIDAWMVRAFWRELGNRIGVTFGEIYPRQDYIAEDGIGNLVRYPFWSKSQFVDPSSWSALEPIEAMEGVKPVSADDFPSICQHLGFKFEKRAPSSTITLLGEASGDGLSPRVVELVNKPGKLKDRWAGKVEGLKDQSRSGLIESIVVHLVRSFVPTGEIVAAVRHWCTTTGYEKGLRDDWIRRTVQRAYEFVASKQDVAIEVPGGDLPTYGRLTCAELDAAEFPVDYLVRWLLVAGQPCILAGGKKCLKTSLLIALAIALATGRRFLGKFEVPRAVRVMLMSGESGMATIQETARRIAASMELDLAGIENLIVSPDLPLFGDVRHLQALEKAITDDEIEVLIIDPAYLAMPTDGNEASLFAMGELLKGMSEVCQRNGVTLILAHHTRKTVTDPYAPPELENIAFAGFQEFTRQWILVGRRERYEPGSGEHRLWLNCGGSAGHSSCYALDINEGRFDGVSGRYWDVEIMQADDARQDVDDRVERAKKAKADQQLEKDKAAILAEAAKHPAGETRSFLRDASGVRGSRFTPAFAQLLSNGNLVLDRLKKGNGQTYEVYRLGIES